MSFFSHILLLVKTMNSEGLILQLMLVSMILSVQVVAAAPHPAPGCPTRCGDVDVPFPFGTRPDCYLDDSFYVFCNTSINPPRLFDSDGPCPLEILEISLSGQMKAASLMALGCYDNNNILQMDLTRNTKFVVSATRNKFTVVGCDTYAFIHGSEEKNYLTGCTAMCDKLDRVENGSCSGIGCCQLSFPKGVRGFNLTVNSYWNHTLVKDFNTCGYAFVVEEGFYNFSSADLMGLRKKMNDSFPVGLDWAVGNLTCQEAQKNESAYACRAMNSECHGSSIGRGYNCKCSQGFQGNPYLVNGCQDINECDTNLCTDKCTNLPGNYSCSCPKGFEGDGRKQGTGCRRKRQAIHTTSFCVALSIILCIFLLLAVSFWLYLLLRKRNLSKLREKFFRQNGGLLLKQKLSKNGTSERDIVFTEEELKKATENYDQKRVIGQGGFGTVYKGILADRKVVAIKKSRVSDQSQIEQFINEVIILSQINHRNVVQLLGCCLETEVPLLVYEFIPCGTLYKHIHDERLLSELTWDLRLKIAAETADAIAYLHSATSVPIVHRDIKTANILLDNNYNAKVSDFGASRFIPNDQAQVTTLVQGTFGYLDPEYFRTSQLTTKSDVYSFGVVLAELITGENALSFDRTETERNLAMYFVSLIEENKLFHIFGDQLVLEGNDQQLKEVAMLAKRCLSLKSEERPTMKDVAVELQALRLMYRSGDVNKSKWSKSAGGSSEASLSFNSINFI